MRILDTYWERYIFTKLGLRSIYYRLSLNASYRPESCCVRTPRFVLEKQASELLGGYSLRHDTSRERHRSDKCQNMASNNRVQVI